MAFWLLIQLFIVTTLAGCALSINVTHTDLHHNETSLKHNTYRFESHQDDLIVRRGGSFDVSFALANVTDESLSLLSLQLMYEWFETGLLPIRSKKDFADQEHTWYSEITRKSVSASTANVTFTITVPLKAAVGVYSLQLKEDSNIIWDLDLMTNGSLYVLFNPYHPSEPVYMNNKNHMKEYLESDLGAVYTGGALYSGGDFWIFGQYAPVVLRSVMTLLNFHSDREKLVYINYTMRTDPIILSRFVADMMHNVDSDYGLMEGRWSGSYWDGTSPSAWKSSVPIYEKYFETGRPVKYAQCWVFAAVATTALRTLGVPSRPITTYDAAHNTNDDLIVHQCNDTGRSSDWSYCGADSIWNFHSWTEAWMTRSDLCDERGHCPTFSGWQVVDATPQEESIHDKTYAVGPSPKAAILSGSVVANYDTSFVFAEVAAPVITWGVFNKSIVAPINVDFKRVGSAIVTKKLNSNTTEFEDITHTYKNADDEWHRVTLIKAFYEKGVNTELLGHNLTLEPLVDIKVDMKPLLIVGETIEFNVTLKNNDPSSNQSVHYSLQLDSVYYTGMVSSNVMNQDFHAILKPNETISHTVAVPFDDYYLRLVETMHLNLVTKLHATESDYAYFNEHDFTLHTPDVSIRNVADVATPGQPLTLAVSFTNTLPFRLTRCTMKIDGQRNFTRMKLPNIRKNETTAVKVTITLDSSPAIFATIDCLELENIRGSLKIN